MKKQRIEKPADPVIGLAFGIWQMDLEYLQLGNWKSRVLFQLIFHLWLRLLIRLTLAQLLSLCHSGAAQGNSFGSSLN